MIRLECFNQKQLLALLDSDRFAQFPFLPITRHRALAHVHNPKLKPEAVVLILAFEDEKLLGYIGILADELACGNEQLQVGWLSTMFVSVAARGKNIAAQLIAKACKVYQGKILITEFTPSAERLYLKTQNFILMEPLQGMAYYFFVDVKARAIGKWPNLAKFSGLLRLADTCAYALAKVFYGLKPKKKSYFKATNSLDDELKHWMGQQSHMPKSLPEIEWMMAYPWLIAGPKIDPRPYHFSDIDPQFAYVFLKIYHDKKLSSVLMISVRKQEAKLILLMGETQAKTAAETLYQWAIEQKISGLICFDEGINQAFARLKVLYRKARLRQSFIHKDLQTLLGQEHRFQMSASDGDAMFT